MTDPAGLALRTTTAYEAPGPTTFLRRTAKTMPKGPGATSTYTYHASGEAPPALAAAQCGAVTASGMLKQSTDPTPAAGSAVTRQYAYDSFNRLVGSFVPGDAHWTCITYDARGRIASEADSKGATTTYDYYSVAGQVTTHYTDSAGATHAAVVQMNLNRQQTSYTDEQGTTTRVTYDQLGRASDSYRKFSGSPEIHLMHWGYDSGNARLTSESDYSASQTAPRTVTFAYDASGRLTTTSLPSGVTTTTGFDSTTGQVSSVANQRAGADLSPLSSTTYTRSAAGRISQESSPGRTRAYTYDPAGRLTQAIEGAATRNYSYDADSNRCSTASTCNGTYSYDNADRLVASPFATSYTYDAHGNLTSAARVQPPTQSTADSWPFDWNDHDVHITTGAGNVSAGVDWTATPLLQTGPTATGTLAAGTNTSGAQDVVSYSDYKPVLTWPAGIHQVADTQGISVAAAGSRTQSVTTAAAGTVTGQLDWGATAIPYSGSDTVGFTPWQVSTNPQAPGYVSYGPSFSPNTPGWATMTANGWTNLPTGGTAPRHIDIQIVDSDGNAVAGRQANPSDTGPQTAVSSGLGSPYAYPPTPSTMSYRVRVNAPSPESFSVQGSYATVSATVAAGSYTLHTTYGRGGNGGSGTATLTGTYPAPPALENIQYDGRDHATSIDDGATTVAETLGPMGRVLERKVTDDVSHAVMEDTLYGYDGPTDSPSYSKPGPASPMPGAGVTTFVQGPSGLLLTDTAGTPAWTARNGHGDVVGTTDAGGAFTPSPATDEFGVGQEPSSRLGWLGDKERFGSGTNLGLVRMGVREYDPNIGRFLEVDPVEGGSANSYDYAGQDPINNVDLDGDSVCSFIHGGLIGMAFHCRRCAHRRVSLGTIRGLERQLRAHEQKLREYREDPLAHDNDGRLARALEDEQLDRAASIINGRINNLIRQIDNFRRQIRQAEENLLDGGDIGGEGPGDVPLEI